MTDVLRWEQPPPTRRWQLLREPARLAVVLGSALTMIGIALPWATGIDQRSEPITFSPITNADGVLFVWCSIAALILVATRSVAESQTRTLQASTAVVGVVAALDWLTAMRAGTPGIVAGEPVVWLSQPDPGVFVTGAGAGLLAIAGVKIAVHAWRFNGTRPDPTDIVVTRRSVIGGLLQGVLAVLGGFVGMYATLAVIGPSGLLLMTLGALAGGGLGLTAGETISRRSSGSASEPRTPRRLRRATWTDTSPWFGTGPI